MTREEIKKLIEKSIKELQNGISEIKLEHPEEKSHGDYATNVAMVIAKQIKKNPLAIAKNIKNQISKIKNIDLFFKKIEVAEPGFINFFLSKEYLQKQVAGILKQKKKFGQLKIGKNKKIQIEFISANPTGPLTLGNGRGGFCGDVLANVLNKAGYKISREYYINDVGEQIKKLGHSVIDDSEAVYKGDYINQLRNKIKEKDTDKTGEKAAKFILEKMIKPSVKKMGINFDVWFSEKSLYKKKEVEKVLKWLKKKNLAYKKEGALWFKSSQFGDDKDRVLVKTDGEKTYLASDIAYLKNKLKRGFNKLIYFWGADHYGYIGRIKAVAKVLGFDEEKIDIIIMQLVRLFEGGKEVRMSKRTGLYVTIDELIDEVGLDVARFFFLTKSPETHLNFDLDLAKEQSEKNPVYYVQYAHARIHSILAKSKTELPFMEAKVKKRTLSSLPFKNRKSKVLIQNLKLLNHPSELELIKQLIHLPEVVEDTAEDYQVQRLPQYAMNLATAFHQFYRHCQVLIEARPLSEARIGLILATKIVLKNTLDLMGISAPEKM